jgi:hypothetical protein
MAYRQAPNGHARAKNRLANTHQTTTLVTIRIAALQGTRSNVSTRGYTAHTRKANRALPHGHVFANDIFNLFAAFAHRAAHPAHPGFCWFNICHVKLL